jgi:major membrane immunogen (membrane-anchored lipoprotein)
MKKIVFVFVIMLSVLGSCGKSDTNNNNNNNKHYAKHNLVYRNQGYTNQMIFHSDTNSYIATIKANDGEFTLIVTDTTTNKEYILNSDSPIKIIGGDITYKK